jgi:flagellar biosynthetic protein FliR
MSASMLHGLWMWSYTFALLCARTGLFLASFPLVWGFVASPRIRVVLCVVLSAACMAVLERPVEPDNYVFQILSEALLGGLIGTTCRIPFWGVSSAGEWIEYHMGLGFGRLVNPFSQEDSGVISTLHTSLCNLIFFASGYYHDFLRGFFYFVEISPPGHIKSIKELLNHMVSSWGDILLCTFFLGLPFVAVSLLTHFSLALLSKSVPQLSIWSVGFVLVISVTVVFYSVYLEGWLDDCAKVARMSLEMLHEMHGIVQ